MDDTEKAEIFSRVFGNQQANTAYFLPDHEGSGEKVEGKSWIEYHGPTADDFRDHVTGRKGIGLSPVGANGRCQWVALDFDVDVPFTEMMAALNSMRNIIWHVFKSKSGKYHAYIFLSSSVQTSLLLGPLKIIKERIIKALGLGKTDLETRPNGSGDKSERPPTLNLPLYGDARLMVNERGLEQTVDQSFTVLEGLVTGMGRTNFQFLAQLKAPKAAPGERKAEEFLGASDEELRTQYESKYGTTEVYGKLPPCLVDAQKNWTATTSGRNNTLYQLAVYLRERGDLQDKIETQVFAYNKEVFGGVGQALSISDVQSVLGSVLNNKACFYKCDAQNFCDKRSCAAVPHTPPAKQRDAGDVISLPDGMAKYVEKVYLIRDPSRATYTLEIHVKRNPQDDNTKAVSVPSEIIDNFQAFSNAFIAQTGYAPRTDFCNKQQWSAANTGWRALVEIAEDVVVEDDRSLVFSKFFIAYIETNKKMGTWGHPRSIGVLPCEVAGVYIVPAADLFDMFRKRSRMGQNFTEKDMSSLMAQIFDGIREPKRTVHDDVVDCYCIPADNYMAIIKEQQELQDLES